jgi:hypothetical protein
VGTSTRLERANDRLSGERERDVAFVSDQPGTLEILPVRFAWFDPEAGSYRSQSSEAVPIRVLPDSAAAGAPVAAGGAALAAPRTGAGPFGALTLNPTGLSSALFGSSALLVGAALLKGRSRRRRDRDPRWVRRRALEPLLARGLSETGEPAAAAARAEEALRKGAGLRYDVDLGGLARPERDGALVAHGAPAAEIAELESLFDQLAAIAYAPPETRRSDAKQAVAALRRLLERYRTELST